VLVSTTPLRRLAAVLGVAAVLAVLPSSHASATSRFADLSAEPSQLWHSEFDASWPLDSITKAVDPAGRSPHVPPSTVILGPGEYLSVGQSAASPNGWYELTLEPDGRLVLRATDDGLGRYGLLWSTEPVAAAMPLLVMHAGGDLTLYDTANSGFGSTASQMQSAVLWSADTRSESGAVLQLDDDGILSVVTPDGRALWRGGRAAPEVGLTGTRHIVYDRGEQWVWLVDDNGSVVDNYPVSGHPESPQPGRYAVTSKSEDAISYNWLVTMHHMVRFTTDDDDDWIGFHSIPRGWRDVPIQTEAELGDPLSLGCVRQRDDKAERLYRWAPIGTPVVVLA
jgi:lipoprotein-anchoring transpeptidase ErfK/SrfK